MFGIYVYEEKNGSTKSMFKTVTENKETAQQFIDFYSVGANKNNCIRLNIVENGKTIFSI